MAFLGWLFFTAEMCYAAYKSLRQWIATTNPLIESWWLTIWFLTISLTIVGFISAVAALIK